MPKLLITRPAEAHGETAALVIARGYTPVHAPLLRIVPRPITVPPDTQAILVTSSNALLSLPVSATPLLAVGDATAARARARNFANVSSAAGDAQALAALAAATLTPKGPPLLLASGARQGLALAADLRARGFSVRRRVCYEVRDVAHLPPAAAEAVRSGDLHAAMFMSAETAACFVRLCPASLHAQLAGVTALAISAGVQSVLEVLPWRRILVASHPTLEKTLELL